ncbi:hypothetical protein [Secundilactobacillus hailunensis]|uniref:hypothetical protein n=1 Tax=Secundilactobacillus hailunensis TaxID=2559923 RepID=UPI001A7F0B8A|nr:hypothetical protein [Secundilactobacillus hailunensis]
MLNKQGTIDFENFYINEQLVTDYNVFIKSSENRRDLEKFINSTKNKTEASTLGNKRNYEVCLPIIFQDRFRDKGDYWIEKFD